MKKISLNTKKLKMQKKIRYKIIKKRTRYSCAINGSSLYALKYPPKTMVFARPETMGVFCFDTLKSARAFLNRHYYYMKNCKIVKVLPIGKGTMRDEIYLINQMKEMYNDLMKNSPVDYGYLMSAPYGTMSYPGVYVIE